jgi:LysW-gamma-L-lysine/LysW-L-ornithine aminotransferase
MNTNAIINSKNIVSTYPNRGIELNSGNGVYLYDQNGEEYLDLMSNFGVNILGHSHPQYIKDLQNQIGQLVNLHSSFVNENRSLATKYLVDQLKKSNQNQLSRVYWGNSGTEAVEAAIKFASLYTNKTTFIAFKNGYHGKTFGSLSITSSSGDKYRKPFKPMLIDVRFAEYNKIQSAEKLISDKIGGIILEPIQGEGGIIEADAEFLMQLQKLAKDNNIPIIVDEIQSGMGRTGRFLNIERVERFKPDILCLSKGLGGGIPVSATIITEDINSKIPKGIHTSTFGGNPLSMGGVISTLQILSNSNLYKIASEMGEYFIQELNTLKSNYPKIIKDVRGVGLMIGLELEKNAIELIQFMQREKILIAPTGGETVRFLPPLVIGKRDIDKAIEQIKDWCKGQENV